MLLVSQSQLWSPGPARQQGSWIIFRGIEHFEFFPVMFKSGITNELSDKYYIDKSKDSHEVGTCMKVAILFTLTTSLLICIPKRLCYTVFLVALRPQLLNVHFFLIRRSVVIEFVFKKRMFMDTTFDEIKRFCLSFFLLFCVN